MCLCHLSIVSSGFDHAVAGARTPSLSEAEEYFAAWMDPWRAVRVAPTFGCCECGCPGTWPRPCFQFWGNALKGGCWATCLCSNQGCSRVPTSPRPRQAPAPLFLRAALLGVRRSLGAPSRFVTGTHLVCMAVGSLLTLQGPARGRLGDGSVCLWGLMHLRDAIACTALDVLAKPLARRTACPLGGPHMAGLSVRGFVGGESIGLLRTSVELSLLRFQIHLLCP